MINLLEIAGIVFLRFRLLPRIWCVWLVGVNAACLVFLGHVEAQVVLAVTLAALIAMAILYEGAGFTRLLGVAHILWVPMFAWMAGRLDSIATEPGLATWLAVLFATNLVSFIVDVTDVTRYLRGERAPHYRWARPQDA